MVKVAVGGLEVLDSGSVIVFGKRLEFTFDDGNGELKVRCVFENDENFPSNHLVEDEENDDEEQYTLRFVNFNRATGVRSKGAIEVGEYDDRKLLLRYVISAVDEYKQVGYTWYLK